jgi:hypothetical protein
MIGCIAVALFGIAVICGVGALFYNFVSKNPNTRPGFGVVRSLGTHDGWTEYSFRDCDLTIELQNPPVFSPILFSYAERLRTASYSRYLSQGKMGV